MVESVTNPLEYYVSHGPISDPKEYSRLFYDIPDDVPSLCRVVQGILLHIHWAERYGVRLSEARKEEVQLRWVAHMLARIVEIDNLPLAEPRPLQKRLVGNCRDFSLMLCSILRHKGIPARARCGFGTYFAQGHYEDHWVCEYWNGTRWVMVDAQLDEFQKNSLGIDFDPLDVPHDRFLVAGKAWLMCRERKANPDHFGIFDMHGMWFIRSNLLRDFASLNKRELLPWDAWGLAEKKDDEISKDDMDLLDRSAMLTLGGNEDFFIVRNLYENEERLRVPKIIKSFSGREVKFVDLSAV